MIYAIIIRLRINISNHYKKDILFIITHTHGPPHRNLLLGKRPCQSAGTTHYR